MALTLAAPRSKDALVLEKRRLSYDDLLRRAWALAEDLRRVPGDQVVIFSENSLEWAIVAYAIWAADKVLVPIDAQASSADVAYVLDDCKAAVLYISKETRKTTDSALKGVETRDKIQVRSLEEILQEQPGSREAKKIEIEDEERLATIIYTSGTTGDPKGVMLTFANLHENLKVVRDAGYFAPDERVLLLLPLHHILPLVGCLVGPLATGGTSVLCPSLARDDVVRALQDHKITMLVGVPRFFDVLGRGIRDRINSSLVARQLFRWAEAAQSEGFSKTIFKKVHQGFGGELRYMICGGAPLDQEITKLFQTLGFRLCEGYGMTECAPLISFPRPDQIKPGYCGKPVPGARVELRAGEIVVQGPQVMRGYFNRPEETSEVLKDGWLYTGDLGEFDDEGYLKITGRKKEILVLPNGKNVNPQLSELMMEGHDEVSEAGVYLDGDVLHALLVLNPELAPQDEKDLESWVWTSVVSDYNQRVAPYRQIARVTVVEEPLPRTRLSKLRRHLLEDIGKQARKEDTLKAPKNEAEQKLVGYLRGVGCPQVSTTSRLGADLGVDSMARLELREFIRKTWGATLDESELNERLRVNELAKLVQERANDEVAPADVDWKEILNEGTPAELPRTSPLHVLILVLLRVWVFLGVRLRPHGRRLIPAGPKIFTPNHQSAIDGVFLTAALRLWAARDVFFLAKETHMKHPLMRFVAHRGRVIVMEQSAGLQVSLKAVAGALRQGYSVAIFPEGTRSPSGELGDFKDSYAIVADQVGVPIVPVALVGAGRVLPKGSRFPRWRQRVDVHFLEPLSVDGSPETTNQKVRSRITEKLNFE